MNTKGIPFLSFIGKRFVTREILFIQYPSLNHNNISEASRVFNLDETEVSFRELLSNCNQKGISASHTVATAALSDTRGSLDHLTLMPIVSADGKANSSVIILPYLQAPYRAVNGIHETF